MLTHPTLEQLRRLRLNGMADAYAEQTASPETETLSFDERLGLLVDRERSDRESRQLSNRLRKARLRQQATIVDIDYSAARGIEKTVIRALARCRYIEHHENVIIVGATGTGKTYLACALAHKACLEGYTARYERLSRLLESIRMARADGTYPKFVAALAKISVLLLDDFGPFPIVGSGRNDLLDILEDRSGTRSTIITSQLPVAEWHGAIG
ncbi:IS21-like element helper ATPase IstB, partial [Rhodothermus sp. AH-315-K08]|nr:IS21-like element helper ATPase IstB [Rhodothermus sp. AH-315-K08]